MPLVLVLALAGLLCVAGCRGCSDGTAETAPEASGPTMPTGMLAPLPGTTPSDAPASPAERLALGRGKKSGEWAELQSARPDDGPDRRSFERWQPDSRFLSLEAMGLLHESFARALPGFDLFLPRLFDPAALGRLRAELSATKAQLATITDVRTAKARWGEASSLVAELADDTAWLDARNAFVGTIDELTALSADLEAKGRGLWGLGI